MFKSIEREDLFQYIALISACFALFFVIGYGITGDKTNLLYGILPMSISGISLIAS